MPPGFDLYPGDARNGGHRLPPEAHRTDLVEILDFGDLRGSVLKKTGMQVLTTHPATIVDHLDQGSSRILDDNFDMVGSGVNSVVYQLSDYRTRPLDRLTGCNLVGKLRRHSLYDG